MKNFFFTCFTHEKNHDFFSFTVSWKKKSIVLTHKKNCWKIIHVEKLFFSLSSTHYFFFFFSFTVSVSWFLIFFILWKKKSLVSTHEKKNCSCGKHVKHYLKNVISRFELSDVDPLAVDVVSVSIPAAHSDALLPEVCTFIPLLNTCNKTLQNESNTSSQTLFLVFLTLQEIWEI